MSLIVLCPSFRRPISARAVLDSFNKTKTLDSTRLVFLVYQKDEDSPAYEGDVILCPEKEMVPRVNGALGLLDDHQYVGWIADDNRFETPGWDVEVIKALQSHPIVFCNDVVSPGAKPSHVFMDSRIPKALGWMILPGLHSTFADDVWANLGVGAVDVTGPLFDPEMFVTGGFKTDAPVIYENPSGLGITYLPHARVNHLYIEKEAEWKTRGGTAYKVHDESDLDTYRHWLRHDAENDIAKARKALRVKSLA